MTDTGEILRSARESAGLSLSEVAARTHYTRGHLSNVETGKRAASPDVVLAYERVLGEVMDRGRRGLMAGIAAGVVAPAATAELLRRGFAAAIGDRPSLDEWQSRVEEYGRDYMTVGAGELQSRLAGDLVVLQQQLEGPQRWSVAARLLALYAKTTPGAENSSRWYRMAVTAADRSEDLPSRVRARAALAMAYEGKGLSTAGRLARQAMALSGTPSLGRLNAVMATAHVAGARGDTDTAYGMLDEGKRLFDAVGSDEQVSDYAVPEWRMNTFTSMLLSRMGDERGAVTAQEGADRTRPKSLPRFATHIQMHRGLMMARAGDARGGVAYARGAMAKLPVNRQSLTLRLLMDEVERAGSV